MTGTRNQVTVRQIIWFSEQILNATSLDHGACIGADEMAHDMAAIAGKIVTVHPPSNQKWMMPEWKWYMPGLKVTVLKPLPFLTRNVNIVDATEYLLALPDGPHRSHSGTWHTINYAKSINRPGMICYPDGSTEPI